MIKLEIVEVILMLFLKIILIIVSVAFITFGYKIYFQKKYNLINGFEEDYKNGRKTEAYAKKVGLIEFVFGIVLAIVAICLIIIK